jgi:hypothetical protein
MKKSRKRECAIWLMQDGQISRWVRPLRVYQSVYPVVAAERGHGVIHSPVGFEDRCGVLACRLGACNALGFSVAGSWNLTDPAGRGWLDPD